MDRASTHLQGGHVGGLRPLDRGELVGAGPGPADPDRSDAIGRCRRSDMTRVSRGMTRDGTPALAVGPVGRGVVLLSVGTFAVQAMSAVGQFMLAVWLQPMEYGYWATASSVLAIVTGLVNLGEVGGYLANPLASLRQASRSVFRINLALAIVGFLLSIV